MLACALQRLVAPLLPPDRIVAMLAEIGARSPVQVVPREVHRLKVLTRASCRHLGRLLSLVGISGYDVQTYYTGALQ